VSHPRRQGHRPLQDAVKGVVYAYTPPLLLINHAFYIIGYDNSIQNGPHDSRGPTEAQGLKAKSANRVSARLEQTE
jgi:hypothetical protein